MFGAIISKYFPTLAVNFANYHKPKTERRYLHSKQVITVQQSNGFNLYEQPSLGTPEFAHPTSAATAAADATVFKTLLR